MALVQVSECSLIGKFHVIGVENLRLLARLAVILRLPNSERAPGYCNTQPGSEFHLQIVGCNGNAR